jgi:P27 family predicted phage terminase small subunit
MTYKERIVEHLKSKGTYDPGVDDEVIDDLIENITLSRKVMKQIKTEGVIQTYITTSGSIMSKMNPLVGIYQMFQRNTHQLSSKLGINRNDRLKLKLIDAQRADELDKLLNE